MGKEIIAAGLFVLGLYIFVRYCLKMDKQTREETKLQFPIVVAVVTVYIIFSIIMGCC